MLTSGLPSRDALQREIRLTSYIVTNVSVYHPKHSSREMNDYLQTRRSSAFCLVGGIGRCAWSTMGTDDGGVVTELCCCNSHIIISSVLLGCHRWMNWAGSSSLLRRITRESWKASVWTVQPEPHAGVAGRLKSDPDTAVQGPCQALFDLVVLS